MSLSTRLGFLSGFLSTFLITFLYLIDKTLLVDGFERLTLFFLVGAILYVMLSQRKTTFSAATIKDLQQAVINDKALNQEFASFGELLKLGFRTYVIGFFIKFLFIWFLFNYYDTELIELVKAAYLQLMEQYKNSNEMELIYQQNLEKFKAGNFGPSFKNILGIALELPFGFVISFAAAFFLKRDRPDY